ncbi:hypothetical protein [Lysobacter gummosus]|uniref:hypothetical protein n=1 Tax=Lysobacter gummosus TaxID=262324 RepID=UPI0036441CC9
MKKVCLKIVNFIANAPIADQRASHPQTTGNTASLPQSDARLASNTAAPPTCPDGARDRSSGTSKNSRMALAGGVGEGLGAILVSNGNRCHFAGQRHRGTVRRRRFGGWAA